MDMLCSSQPGAPDWELQPEAERMQSALAKIVSWGAAYFLHEDTRCAYCGGVAQGRRDHILPHSWGGKVTVENMRACCVRCNGLRSACGHCPAAMACLWAVTGDPATTPNSVYIGVLRLWGWCGAKLQRAVALCHGGEAVAEHVLATWPPLENGACHVGPPVPATPVPRRTNREEVVAWAMEQMGLHALVPD